MTLKAVEEAIQEARRRGELDNLPGHGKPLDHTEYFSHPEEHRIAARLLKNSGFVPPEVELMRERGELARCVRRRPTRASASSFSAGSIRSRSSSRS